MSSPDRESTLRMLARASAAFSACGCSTFRRPIRTGWAIRPCAGCSALAGELGVRLSICVLEPDLPRIATLLAAAPDQPIAVDHCGFVELAGGFRSPSAQALVSLASYDNVRLKVTTTMLTMAEQAGAAAADVVEWLSERFGVERLMWGSDYPQHHSEPYPEIVEYGRRACARLSPSRAGAFPRRHRAGALARTRITACRPGYSLRISPHAAADR